MSFYATINNFIAENAIIFSVLIPIISGLAGIYFTYKITIKSDKRKEFNALAEPIVFRLIALYKHLLIDKHYRALRQNEFEHDNFEKIYHKCNRFNKKKLKKLLDSFNKSLGTITNTSVDLINNSDYQKALINLNQLEKFLISRY